MSETVTPMSPAILRPSVIRHSVTGLRIPRVGSNPTATLEMRMSAQPRRSPVPQVMSHGTETPGHVSTVLGQSTQTTSIVDMVLPIDPYTVTRTRPTATITRAKMEERKGLGLDNTSDKDIVNLTSSQESNDEQVTKGYSDDVTSGVEQVREDNEDMWLIGEYEIERSPTPQIPSPVPVVPHRPADIRDILENHPDTEQCTVSLREMGIEAIIGLRTEDNDHEESRESPDSNVNASTSDNRKRKTGDMLETTRSKCLKTETSENTPPSMRPLPTRANNTTTTLLSNRP